MITYQYVLKDGVVTADPGKEKVLAQITYSDEMELTTYYVLCSSGTLYNPYTAGLGYDRPHMRWKLLKVNEGIFNLYLSFLKSRKTATLRQAERLI
jgi:hypothetical protein